MQDLFFCLPEQCLPNDSYKSAQAKGEIPEVEYSIFYNWVYQTWNFLTAAAVPCNISTQLIHKGIILTLGPALPPSFGIDEPLPEDLFLVNIVTDGLPHPAAHLHLVQNRVQAQNLPRSFFIPHWPQPYLIPRNPERGNRFENICFFGELQNLAPEFHSPKWHQRLAKELGMNLKIQGPSHWHNYSDTDCVLAIRDFSKKPHFNKPATKLYNAWLAGVPFIGGADSAYATDGHPGKDYLVATSLEEVFQQLKRLKEDESFRTKLVRSGLQSSSAFTKEATLERWKELVQKIIPQLALQHYKKLERKRRWILLKQHVFHLMNCCRKRQ